MKTFIHITLYVSILLGFCGCNSDVFIDDFEPSVSELALDGNGDSTTIQFKSGNWDWVNIYTIYSDSPGDCKVYDREGNLVENGQSSLLEGLGKIVYQARMAAFTVERSQPKELKITVDENARSTPFEFVIMASNDYETKTINVSISPSERYVIDHIDYSLDAYHYDDQQLEVKEEFIMRNSGETPATRYLFPFKGVRRLVKFTSEDPESFQIVANNDLTVEIPGIKENDLVMSGERIKFVSDIQELPLPFPDTEQKEIILPPHSSQYITLLLGYEWFETRFTLYATHPRTGRQRIITGILQSKTPRKCFLMRENIND